ncbi:MAG: prefoldin subunit alpha [Candidatus Thermoplasmatota archaeon]|nr:prefoldin subunit alpha [Candidatus Thermoplasmatota archaeon]
MKEKEETKARELQETVYLLELKKAQFSTLEKQIALLDITYNDNLRAKETLTNYDKLSDGNEILVPIGGEIFLYAKIDKIGKALVGIGGDVTVEKSVAEAIKRVEDRLKEIESARIRISDQAEKVQSDITKLTERIRALYEAQSK